MNRTGIMTMLKAASGAPRQGGAVLVVALIMVAALSLLAIASTSNGALELEIAGNDQYQTQAFYAAEAGIEQAIASGGFSAASAVSAEQFDNPNSPNPTPRRGSGTQIKNCRNQSLSPADRCEYFVRPDLATGPTPLPGSDGINSGLAAYHFVIESFGVAGRGAQAQLAQGFYVVVADGASPPCIAETGSCDASQVGAPVRTYWRQYGAD
jgi:hypothetical protein